LAQVERLLQEYLSGTYPDTASAYSQKLHDFDLDVLGVSSRFHTQYTRILTENSGNIEAAVLQERAKKGAEYFYALLLDLHDLACTTRLDIDNASVAKRMKTALSDLRKLTAIRVSLLKYVSEEGFHMKPYLDRKAKVLLDAEGGRLPKEKSPKNAQAHEPKKVALPQEVKNTVLYYRLQQWRRRKAAETGKPAYSFLQTKALIAIANYAPTEPRELLRMPCFGEKSLESYGKEILEIVSGFLREKADNEQGDESSQLPAEKIADTIGREGESSWDVSLRLYKQGCSPARIAEMRDLQVNTVVGHLARFLPTGEVKIEELVSSDHIERIKQYISAHPYTPETSLSELRNSIGDDITYGELRMVLATL